MMNDRLKHVRVKNKPDFSIDITPKIVSKKDYDKFVEIYNEMPIDWELTLATPFSLFVIAIVVIIVSTVIW